MTDYREIADIPGLVRIENTDLDEMMEKCMELTHAVYPHDQMFGRFCTVEEYIDCPPEIVFDYLADANNLSEWTYSTRDMKPAGQDGLVVFYDAVGGKTTNCYCRTESNREAMTVNYHCAWDQGDHLWMIYLIRVVPARLVLDRPGAVVIWTNCRHPFYDANPFPDKAPADREGWVGDVWDMFFAGHAIEMRNLKTILEHRHGGESTGGAAPEDTP